MIPKFTIDGDDPCALQVLAHLRRLYAVRRRPQDEDRVAAVYKEFKAYRDAKAPKAKPYERPKTA